MRTPKAPLNKAGFTRLLLVSFALFISVIPARSQTQPMELWYMHHSYLTSSSAVTSSQALIDQAVAAGYTGLLLWDTSLARINPTIAPTAVYVKQVLDYAASKGLKVMPELAYYGYSNDILRSNPNWAEGQRVVGAQFRVNSSKTGLNFVSNFLGFSDPGFEGGKTDTWFSYNDPGMGVDYSTAHSGAASVLIQNNPMDARIVQQIGVTPWRQYHLRIWAKTQGFSGPAPYVFVYDSANSNAVKLNATMTLQTTQDWTQYDWTINSGPSTRLQFATGLWGPGTGSFWLDDIQLEETALIYVLRRDGTPLRVYDSTNNSTIYSEGKDYNPIADAKLVSTADFGDTWHMPTAVTLPSSTSLLPGQLVNIDFYAAQPLPGSQMGMCLTEPGVSQWVHDNAQAVMALAAPSSPVLLAYDEMRHMNSCAQCRAKNLTAGQLLAWNFGQTITQFNAVAPSSPLYVWSDMFDPYANAHADYYLVEGDIAGSWNGVPSNITIMNWNLSNLPQSLKFFAGQTSQSSVVHKQVIAGFYDPYDNDGANAAKTVLSQAYGVPGVQGLMYTTWWDNYSQLGTFAAAAKAGWAAYLASVAPKVNTGNIQGAVMTSSGTGLAGATITASSSSAPPVSTTSSSSGAFSFTNLAAGTYTLAATLTNYQTAAASVTVTAGQTVTANLSLTAVVTPAFSPIRVNAGGAAYTALFGLAWSSDTGFLNGSTYSTAQAIKGTINPVLYQSERSGSPALNYSYTVPNGSYIVTLKFAEILFTQPGRRIFSVTMNGQAVLTNFDIVASAGALTAIDKSFAVKVTGGKIEIGMTATVSNPKVSAIEITAH